jgi:hypothetical protein
VPKLQPTYLAHAGVTMTVTVQAEHSRARVTQLTILEVALRVKMPYGAHGLRIDEKPALTFKDH